MINISHVASYLPERFIDNVAQAEEFGESSGFVKNKIGALRLPRIEPSEDCSDMGVIAVRRLVEKSNIELNDIEVIVVVTQNGDGHGLPHSSAIIHEKLGLSKSVAAFDISLGCSGYVYSLSIVKGFMQEIGAKRGVLVTSDPYSKILDVHDKNTSLIFGDAATATLLEKSDGWSIGQPMLYTDGSGWESICVKDGLLKMNGRNVFNFAFKEIPLSIQELLKRENVSEEDIDAFILHQGSYAIVDAISRSFPNSREKFVKNIADTGNTVSSSIPLILEGIYQEDGYRNILVSGFGVGLSWGSCLLRRVKL